MICINVKTNTLTIENETVLLKGYTKEFPPIADILDGITINNIISLNNRVNVDLQQERLYDTSRV